MPSLVLVGDFWCLLNAIKVPLTHQFFFRRPSCIRGDLGNLLTGNFDLPPLHTVRASAAAAGT